MSTSVYDWDEEHTATQSLLIAYQEFDAACAAQSEAELVIERQQQILELRDKADQLRLQKHPVWMREPHPLDGLYNPFHSFNRLGTLALNGLLEWRARRLEHIAYAMDVSEDAE